MDRCDTDPCWFLFSSCGRPFMFAREGNAHALAILKQERRRRIGSTIELRAGNYAAATIDELLSSWREPRVTSAQDGSFVHIDPYDLMEECA